MKQWFIKHFRKTKAIKVILFTEDKRMQTYWVIPKGDQVSVAGRTFLPLTMKAETMSPARLKTALDAKVAEEIFASVDQKMNIKTLVILFGIINLVGFALIGYFGLEHIGTLQEQIAQLRQLIETIGGLPS